MVKSRMDKKGTENNKRFPLVLPAALCAANGKNGNSLVGISNNNSFEACKACKAFSPILHGL